jgi:hypothetical protein
LITKVSPDPSRRQAVIQEKEGFSIPAQLKLLREYAAANSFAVMQEYVDVKTARQSGRAGFFGQVVDVVLRHQHLDAVHELFRRARALDDCALPVKGERPLWSFWRAGRAHRGGASPMLWLKASPS